MTISLSVSVVAPVFPRNGVARLAITASGVLALSAGLALSQTYTWQGGSANWNAAGPWDNALPVAGAAGGTLSFPGSPAQLNVVTATNNMATNPYPITRLTFGPAGGEYLLAGRGIRISQPGAVVAGIHTSSPSPQTIALPIQLDTRTTTISSSANAPNGNLTFSGVISERPAQNGAARNGLSIVMGADTHRVLLSAANTFTLNTRLSKGTLVLANNQALGLADPMDNQLQTGGLVIENTSTVMASDAAPLNNASGYRTVASSAHVFLGGDVTFGGTPDNANRRALLGFAGPVRIGALPNAGGTRTITLAGGANHVTEFAGDIVLRAQDALSITGDTAPTLNAKGKLPIKQADKRTASGSRLVISGNAQSFSGAMLIRRSTVEINGALGSPNNRVQESIVVDGFLNPAALIGKNVGNNNINVFFANNLPVRRRIDVQNGGLFQPGASPGIFGIDGGDVTFRSGSAFGIDVDGTLAGNGNGYHAQLLLVDGGLEIEPNATLGVDVSAIFDSSAIGSVLKIVDITNQTFTTSGYFANPLTGQTLLEGATFFTDGVTFQISYAGGDGNDVTLTMLSIPAPSSAAALAGMIVLGSRRRRQAARI